MRLPSYAATVCLLTAGTAFADCFVAGPVAERPLFREDEWAVRDPPCDPPYSLGASSVTVLDDGNVFYSHGCSEIVRAADSKTPQPFRPQSFHFKLTPEKLEDLKKFLNRGEFAIVRPFMSAGVGIGNFQICFQRAQGEMKAEALSFIPNHISLKQDPALLHLICKARELSLQAVGSGKLPEWCQETPVQK